MDIPLLLMVIVVFGIYAAIVIWVKKSKSAERLNLATMMGIFVAWRTRRGRALIEKMARAKRFWRWYGNVAIAIVLVCAVLMALTLVFTSIAIWYIPQANKPSAQMLIGLPGINPIIPLWYGILALAISIVLHEFAHATLTRVAGLDLKSMGLLFLVVPMGAFAEPDEEQLLKTSKRKRARVFGVGPATNIILALVCALIFSWSMMGSLQPSEDGLLVTGYSKSSELYKYGTELGMVITSINGTNINNVVDYDTFPGTHPGTNITVGIYYSGEKKDIKVPSGVMLIAVHEDTPAYQAGLKVGMILVSIDHKSGNTTISQVVHNNNDFSTIMAGTSAGQKADIRVLENKNGTLNGKLFSNVTLDDKFSWTKINSDKGHGFLGVSSAYLGVYVDSVSRLSGRLTHPLAGAKDFYGFLDGVRFYISLPVIRLSPMDAPLTDVYQPTGFWGAIPEDAFWVTANCFYWLFWLNLMLGLTNALPAVPFDGGYIYKDFVDMLFVRTRPKMDKEKREKYVAWIVYTTSFILIGMIFLMFFATLF